MTEVTVALSGADLGLFISCIYSRAFVLFGMPWPVIQRAIYGNSVLSDRVIGEPDTCEHNKEFTSHWGKACIWRLIPVSQAVVIELNCGDCEEVSTCMPLCVMMSSKYRTS